METVVRRKFSNAIVWLQIPLIVAAIAVYAYVWAGIRPLLEQRQQLTSDIAGLTTKKDALQKEIESLRSGIESLNYAKVTPQNQVFQLQASAKALPGQKTSDGKPIYQFSIKVNASPEVLQNITKVAYDFNHPTFHQPHREETDRANNFQTQYIGWGCLSPVDVTVYLKDGTKQSIPFDMCKSLGGDWAQD